MRLAIQRRVSVSRPLRQVLPSTEILEERSHARWQWTWIDGTVASCSPRVVWRKTARGSFVAGGIEVLNGVVKYQHFGITAIAGVEWNCGDQALSDVPKGCCGGVIQQSNRLLAAWRRCPRVEVVIRDSVPGSLQCICIGMVLTQNFG